MLLDPAGSQGLLLGPGCGGFRSREPWGTSSARKAGNVEAYSETHPPDPSQSDSILQQAFGKPNHPTHGQCLQRPRDSENAGKHAAPK